ncbi:alpha/beta hydrolase [Pseudomonas sp. R5(2019)]|uniref:alpha/beta hydrolase n=1 Tax=Pseudomonas sp. R5(2019) TaxID=2697566 RepID=UPI0015B67E39|nr:alpha/beta hydrolase [Pseudomonas sp. R5(2019)]
MTGRPQHQHLWQFNEPCQGTEGFITQHFGEYTLEGRVLGIEHQQLPSVFVIAGARSDYTKLNPLLYRLQARGIASLTGNLSGHSDCAMLKPSPTTLNANLREAERFHNLHKDTLNIIIGHSLGGALALKLAARYSTSTQKLILICPAIYADSAYPVEFGPGFKHLISQPYSFLFSDTFEFLRTFEGRVLLIMGQYDGLEGAAHGQKPGTSAGLISLDGAVRYSPIPKEVIDKIKQSARHLISITLPGCDHYIAAHLRANPVIAEHLADEVFAFINN